MSDVQIPPNDIAWVQSDCGRGSTVVGLGVWTVGTVFGHVVVVSSGGSMVEIVGTFLKSSSWIGLTQFVIMTCNRWSIWEFGPIFALVEPQPAV